MRGVAVIENEHGICRCFGTVTVDNKNLNSATDFQKRHINMPNHISHHFAGTLVQIPKILCPSREPTLLPF